MFTDEKKEVSLEVADPNAAKPARKENALKKLLKQLQSTGNPPLEGEEVLPPKLIGDGNYHWYPLAWTRWLVKWEQFKTMVLLVIVALLGFIWLVISHRDNIQVGLPQPAEEMLLTANKFSSFDRQNMEPFMHFVICAANESSQEGNPSVALLQGSIRALHFHAAEAAHRGQKNSHRNAVRRAAHLHHVPLKVHTLAL